MSYIVLDLEFNQAYDFEDGYKTTLNPACRFEIIQIGAVKLDDYFNIIESFNKLIKPQIYDRIHPYVEKITGFTEETFKNCPYFSDVFNDFSEFTADLQSPLFCVWGGSDIKALYRNLMFYNLIKPPIIIKYTDVQILATKYLKYSRGGAIGLKNAVDLLEIKTDENFHNAYYDALYTAKVFKIVKSNKIPVKIFNSAHIRRNAD